MERPPFFLPITKMATNPTKCKLGGYFDYAGDASIGVPPCKMPWSYPEETPLAPVPLPNKQKRCPTPAEEVWELVQEWYKSQGKSVPVAEAKACLAMIKEEKNPQEVEPEPDRPKTMEELLGPKPMWGDPIFWDYWRKAKALGFTNDKKKKEKTPKAPKVPKEEKTPKAPKEKTPKKTA
jgi:hypothetical protein